MTEMNYLWGKITYKKQTTILLNNFIYSKTGYKSIPKLQYYKYICFHSKTYTFMNTTGKKISIDFF